ncbi:hypothetical protein PMAYCL1PPCAC_25026, partial [Pristionchus mayeri]
FCQVLLNAELRIGNIISSTGNYQWSTGNNYDRFTTCTSTKLPLLHSAAQPSRCSDPIASVIDTTGYWSNTISKNNMSVICTKDALNDFTPLFMCSPKIKLDSKVVTTNGVHTCIPG